MFCRNCGKELAGTPEYCMNCGARPLIGNKFCHACAVPTNPLAEICIKCGARLTPQAYTVVSGGKSKTASVLLAVFLSFWTWLYTYKKDAWKFWVGLGVSILIFVVAIGIWVWAIVDVAVKNDEWYRSY